MNHYKPLKVTCLGIAGVGTALQAMRLPHPQTRESTTDEDFALASRLVRAGDDHAKAMRGIMAWYKIQCQVGWLIEYEQYEIGVTRLSSSSSMHDELKLLRGEALAERKQRDLADKVYTLIDCASYQALRRMYLARRNHRHPDWQVFCTFIESLPHFHHLICPEEK
jgi:hypothetical protein